MIVALGISTDGSKIVLSLLEGRKNASVVRALLQDLEARGLNFSSFGGSRVARPRS